MVSGVTQHGRFTQFAIIETVWVNVKVVHER